MSHPYQSSEWIRVSVRDPQEVVADSNYLKNLYDGIQEAFVPWFENPTSSFAEMLRLQHEILVGGLEKTGTYAGFSRRAEVISQKISAIPGKFRHELYTEIYEEGWTAQIDVARQLKGFIPENLRPVRDKYMALLREQRLEEPKTDAEFVAFIQAHNLRTGRIVASAAGLPRDLWPLLEVYENFIRHTFSKHPDLVFFLDEMGRKMEQIRSLIQQGLGVEMIDLLSDFIHLGVNAHPFNIGNFSPIMAQANWLLAKIGLRGISHGNLDYRAFVVDHETFRNEYRVELRKENPSL